MARLVEPVERNDWAAARALHTRLLPLLLDRTSSSRTRFRSRPRWRGWGCSTRCTGCRWCRRATSRATKIDRVLADLGLVAGRGGRSARMSGITHRPSDARRRARRSISTPLPRASRSWPPPTSRTRRDEARAVFAELRRALSEGLVRAAEPDASVADRLARQRLGQARHPARVPRRRARRRVGGPRPAAVLRQGHAAAEAAHARRERAPRSRRIVDPRRRLRRRPA